MCERIYDFEQVSPSDHKLNDYHKWLAKNSGLEDESVLF